MTDPMPLTDAMPDIDERKLRLALHAPRALGPLASQPIATPPMFAPPEAPPVNALGIGAPPRLEPIHLDTPPAPPSLADAARSLTPPNPSDPRYANPPTDWRNPLSGLKRIAGTIGEMSTSEPIRSLSENWLHPGSAKLALDTKAFQDQLGQIQTASNIESKERTGDIAEQRIKSAQDIATQKGVEAEKLAAEKGQLEKELQTSKTQAASDLAAKKAIEASDLESQKQAGRKEIASLRANVLRELKADKAASGTKPTPRIQAMADMARTTLPHIDALMTETKNVADLLGPAAGRYSEFMTGKVGAPNPRFAHYMDEMSFLDSAITLAHSQGRVSNLIYDNFKRMFDAGKQSPENMMEALKVAKEWLQGYADMAGGSNTPTASGGGEAPEGTRIQMGDGTFQVKRGGKWQKE